MPAVSQKQQRFFGAELGRAAAGKKTRTGMSEKKLEEFARRPVSKSPARTETASSPAVSENPRAQAAKSLIRR